MRFASAEGVLSGVTRSNKESVHVTWQLFYTISWPLKNLKETVVFYYVLYNLSAFKDDFPWPFLLVVLPVPLRATGVHRAGEPRQTTETWLGRGKA